MKRSTTKFPNGCKDNNDGLAWFDFYEQMNEQMERATCEGGCFHLDIK